MFLCWLARASACGTYPRVDTRRGRWVIIHPESTKRTAALLGAEPVDWFASVSVALNCAQFAALFAFGLTTGRVDLWNCPSRLAAAPWRAVCAPLFLAGLVFKVSIFSAIGKAGVYYGAKFGHTIPWVHGFPFSVTGAARGIAARQRAGPSTTPRSTCVQPHAVPRARAAHPQYLGSSLCIAAVGIALHDDAFPGNALVSLWWITLYVLTGIAEEGLCHSCEPYAPLPPGADVRRDIHSRPVVTAEAVRLALTAPVTLLRLALFGAVLASFLVARRVVEARAAISARGTA